MNFTNMLRWAYGAESHIQTDLTHYKTVVESILQLAEIYHRLSDDRIHKDSLALKKRIRRKGSTDKEDLISAFALVVVACARHVGLYPFQNQIIAGLAMHEGKVVQMQTGEGKTMAAVAPAYLNSLLTGCTHILTFNDYLARRDANWMGPVYSCLGLDVAFVDPEALREQRRISYSKDVCYVTAKQLGFDYLRSLAALQKDEIIVSSLQYAIIDEADAILIDEARHPLVLAGNWHDPVIDFDRIASFIRQLEPGSDFRCDKWAEAVFLTGQGLARAEKFFDCENLQDPAHLDLLAAVHLTLYARVFVRNGIDYIVGNGQVKIVDEFTGRTAADRRWRHGLHSSVEALEGISVTGAGSILNSITIQHLLSKFQKKAGMTATAVQSGREFAEFYGMQTVVIPRRLRNKRVDHHDRVFRTILEKEHAIVGKVLELHQTGQPVLLGTQTVSESERLANKIRSYNVPCQILNAANDQREAEIITRAGLPGQVTISTNMAGRGTDIVLGGDSCSERRKVEALGGLFVLGTNKHESARIDAQLRGRAGRQGDPGETQFFLSLEDDLMTRYGLIERIPSRIKKKLDRVEESYLSRFFQSTQKSIENQIYDVRQTLILFSEMIEMQRNILFSERERILLEDDHLLRLCALPSMEAWRISSSMRERIRKLVLHIYTREWSIHLEKSARLREGIHLVRLAGQHPLREFNKQIDSAFEDTQRRIRDEINQWVSRLLGESGAVGEDLPPVRPKATWTYVVQELPYQDALSSILQNPSNIGLQTDFIGATLLFLRALCLKVFGKRGRPVR